MFQPTIKCLWAAELFHCKCRHFPKDPVYFGVDSGHVSTAMNPKRNSGWELYLPFIVKTNKLQKMNEKALSNLE